MKNKLLKTGFLSLLLMFGLTNTVHAEKANVCTNYRDYYLFNEINTIEYISNNADEDSKNWQRQHKTYYPNLRGATNSVSSGATDWHDGKVCLSKNGVVEGTGENACTTMSDITWDLDTFYNNYKKIKANGTGGTFSVGSNEDVQYLYYDEPEAVVENGEKYIVRYFLHGYWCEEKTDTETGAVESNCSENEKDISSKDNKVLIDNSILPIISQPTMTFEKNYITALVQRTLNTSQLDGINGFDLNDNKKWILTPAAYYSEYTLCEEKDVYKAQIDYVYTDGSEAAPSHNEDELEAGYTNKVTSPTIKNCTPDKENVTISIDKDNPEDFYEKVIYTCKTDKEANNPKTGSALIFVAWVVGIGALGYAVYYFTKLKKSKAE